MRGSERLFAFQDDIYTLSTPSRVGAVHATVAEELGRHAHMSINEGKTNMGGIEPEACAALQQVAKVADPTARVWRGAGIVEEQQACARSSSGPPKFCQSPVERDSGRPFLLSPMFNRVGSCSCIALPPEPMTTFGGVSVEFWGSEKMSVSTLLALQSLPLALGDLGLRSALRTRSSAVWASWAPPHGVEEIP